MYPPRCHFVQWRSSRLSVAASSQLLTAGSEAKAERRRGRTASSLGWMTSSRPVVGVQLEVVVQFAVAPLWITSASTEQLEAILFALRTSGACGSAHGRHEIDRERHERGSSLRHGDDSPR